MFNCKLFLPRRGLWQSWGVRCGPKSRRGWWTGQGAGTRERLGGGAFGMGRGLKLGGVFVFGGIRELAQVSRVSGFEEGKKGR